MPTISVIIAAKDASGFIAACLDSVASQDLPSEWNLEIKLGVDGCELTTAAAASLRPRVNAHFFPGSHGPYRIFNSLLRSAAGNIITRFDADDVMIQGHLASQIFYLSRAPTPMIVRNWSIYTDVELHPTKASLSDGRTTSASGHRESGSDGQFAAPRTVWNRLGGFRPWMCNADSEFLSRARYAGYDVRDIPFYTYLRRVHCNSLTQSAATSYLSEARRLNMAFTEGQAAHFRAGMLVPRISHEILPHQALFL